MSMVEDLSLKEKEREAAEEQVVNKAFQHLLETYLA